MNKPEFLKHLKDCTGKTIVGYAMGWDDKTVLLKFTDGTAFVLEAGNNWDSFEISEEAGIFDIEEFKEDDLLKLGILDQAYIDGKEERQRLETAKREQEREAAERMQYIILKKKFEQGEKDNA